MHSKYLGIQGFIIASITNCENPKVMIISTMDHDLRSVNAQVDDDNQCKHQC
jgi:hypothetical protein